MTTLDAQLANCRDYWLAWGWAARVDGTISYYRSGVPDGQLNGVLRIATGELVDACAGQLIEQLRGVPWLWWVGADSGPDVANRLTAHGAEHVGTVPVMTRSLDRPVTYDLPAEVTIEVVETDAALAEWVSVYCTCFGVPTTAVADTLRGEAGRTDAGPVVRFAATVAGRMVGTALLLTTRDVAGIYVVTTLPEYRRRGIGTAVTAAALETARERGYRVATLQASSLGAPVYRRMGFEKVAEYQLFRFPEPSVPESR
jgi:GNAT superfamily N-acetyltransferase